MCDSVFALSLFFLLLVFLKNFSLSYCSLKSFFGHIFRPHPFIVFCELGMRSDFLQENRKNPSKPKFQGIMELIGRV